MLARLGNLIYWISCGVSAVALLFAAMSLVSLVLPEESGTTTGELRHELEILSPSEWRKVGEGEIMVERVGIVEIEGDVPNETEQRAILQYLREQEARQAEKELKRERQMSYVLLIVFTGLAVVSWLVGRAFRYVLASK